MDKVSAFNAQLRTKEERIFISFNNFGPQEVNLYMQQKNYKVVPI